MDMEIKIMYQVLRFCHFSDKSKIETIAKQLYDIYNAQFNNTQNQTLSVKMKAETSLVITILQLQYVNDSFTVDEITTEIELNAQTLQLLKKKLQILDQQILHIKDGVYEHIRALANFPNSRNEVQRIEKIFVEILKQDKVPRSFINSFDILANAKT